MLPGKQFTPEDILLILRRRYWLVLIPFALVAAVTAAVARKLPDRYRSETLILVIPQRVPEAYVRSTVTASLEDRLQSISQQILSRTRLERVIQEFNLYAEERRTGIMEDIVDQMRADLDLRVVRGDAFRVAFSGSEPRTVMRVTDRLASLFIEENLRDREVLAEGTSQFLEAQLDDSRRRLIGQEKRLEEYRRQYAGELPTQLAPNLQAVQNTQMQIQQLGESINRDGDRRLALEREQAELFAAGSLGIEPSAGGAAPAGTAAQQLEEALAQLKGFELRLKPDHPDLGILRRRIADLRQKADVEALAIPVSAEGARPTSAAAIARQRRMIQVREELEQLDKQIAQKLAEEKKLRAVSAAYLARVEAAPTRETELIELMRDYTVLQTMYSNLLTKREDSKIAANLERRQIGEQFKVIDSPRVPERPYSPNRQRINFMGMAGGLGLGVFLILVLEYRDRSFKTDDEVTKILSLPVLAVVPLMKSDHERRRSFRRRAVLNLGLGTAVMACLAVVVYTFVR